MRESVILGCLLIAAALVLLYFGFLGIDQGIGKLVNLEGRVMTLDFVPKHWHRSGAMAHTSQLIPDRWYVTVIVENRKASLGISRELFNNLTVGAPVMVECSRGKWFGRIYLLRIISKA